MALKVWKPDYKPEPRPKKAKSYIRRTPIKKTGKDTIMKEKYVTPKKTGELALFLTLWNTRPHESELSGIPIEHFSVSCMAHLLAKGLNKYPAFKLYDKNIMILTEYEHHLLDAVTIESRGRYQQEMKELGYDCDWQKIFDRQRELKIEYQNK
jgi:hypothetical protein